MNKIILCFVLSALLITLVSGRPCARCYGDGVYCGVNSGGSCFGGYKCATLQNGAAPVCLPTVAAGAACADLAYNPCPSRYTCDPDLKTCQLQNGIAKINDACTTDDHCEGSLTCSNGLCANTATPPTSCSAVGCPLHQKCDLVNLELTCVNKGAANDACTTDNDCWLSSCIAGTCRALFSAVENGDCNSIYDCELGLECAVRSPVLENKCYKPILNYLDGTTVRKWGRECDASDGDAGCTCNQATGLEQFLIERNPILKQACADAHTKYYECLATNNCYQTETFEGACSRTNCNAERIARENECVFLGSPPVRCSASNMMLALAILIAMLLL